MYPLHRWRAFADLTSDEQDALVSLGDREVALRPGQVIRNQGDPVSGLYLLVRGWVFSSLELRDGRRIIQKVHLPGDMLGTPSMTLTKAADTLTAITGAVVAFVPFERVAALYSQMPRLSGLFTFAALAESVALLDAIVAVARLSADGRIARLLLDFHARLTIIGEVRNDAFDLPLTQEAIGDLTGMTNVHVNRTIRKLCDQGLIARKGRTFRLKDVDRLRALAPLPNRQLSAQPRWLPALQ